MELKTLYEIVERHMIKCEQTHTDPTSIEIVIPIKSVRSIGGTPCVDIKSIVKGFDWDNNKLMLYPEKDLSLTDHDYLATMRKQAEELGWSVYEFQGLKAENAKLRKLIKELKSQLGEDLNDIT